MNEIDTESVEALLSIKNGFAKVNGHQEETEKVEKLQLCPSLFGLKRVDEVAKIQAEKQQQPPKTVELQTLNRRGTPARVRKKNKFFYDDEIYNPTFTKKESSNRTPVKIQPNTPNNKSKSKTPTPSKRSAKKTAVQYKPVINDTKPVCQDSRINQNIGLKLRNLLKLPKAYNWVCSEWFYSNIDRPLFLENNDFIICLKESFPQLRNYNLTRTEWSMIRRMMGKPRRCSQNFFAEEIRELERRRSKIRLLQQRKASEITGFKDVPEEIPLQPVIGTSVTARLRAPKKGLFTGRIDAVDTSNNTYRVTFDRPGLGTHSIPDYEVLSNDLPETISKTTLLQSFRPRNMNSLQMTNKVREPLLSNDPMLSVSSSNNQKLSVDVNGMVGEHPLELLQTIVRLKKILYIKKAQIQSLREMNTETERMSLYGQSISEEFQTRYAGNIIALEMINHDLSEIINSLNYHLKKLGPNDLVSSILSPAYLQDHCHTMAQELVKKNNVMASNPLKMVVEDDELLSLITDLTSLMLQIKSLAEYDRKPYEVEVLKKTMVQIKLKLSPSNQKVFESCIEIHMQHIQDGLTGFRGLVSSAL